VVKSRGFVGVFGASLIALAVAGCSTNGVLDGTTLTFEPPPATELEVAKARFAERDYGLAAKHFRTSVETDPKNAEAWLGLAASYDQLRRFDLADKAYNEVRNLVGETPAVMNNRGYSYLLRGKLDKSRELLATAYANDPGNVHIINNIDLLNTKLTSLGRPPVLVN
jgi:Flp pilus assembly protein TadD